MGYAFSDPRRFEDSGAMVHHHLLPSTEGRRRTRRRRRPKTAVFASSTTPYRPRLDLNERDRYLCIRCGMVKTICKAENYTHHTTYLQQQQQPALTLGRVTIVNWDHQVVLDTHIKLLNPAYTRVIDYQTQVSGITPHALSQAQCTLEQIRSKIGNLIKGKIMIGHGLVDVDLVALGLNHPGRDIRDVATWCQYMTVDYDEQAASTSLPRDLHALVDEYLPHLSLDTLSNGSTALGATAKPVYEARCIMELYKLVQKDWEQELSDSIDDKARQRQTILQMRGAAGCEPAFHHQQQRLREIPRPATHKTWGSVSSTTTSTTMSTNNGEEVDMSIMSSYLRDYSHLSNNKTEEKSTDALTPPASREWTTNPLVSAMSAATLGDDDLTTKPSAFWLTASLTTVLSDDFSSTKSPPSDTSLTNVWSDQSPMSSSTWNVNGKDLSIPTLSASSIAGSSWLGCKDNVTNQSSSPFGPRFAAAAGSASSSAINANDFPPLSVSKGQAKSSVVNGSLLMDKDVNDHLPSHLLDDLNYQHGAMLSLAKPAASSG